MTHWLSLAIWIPIGFGVAILAGGRDRNPDVIRSVALIGCLLALAVTVPLYTGFDPSSAQLQFVENAPGSSGLTRTITSVSTAFRSGSFC